MAKIGEKWWKNYKKAPFRSFLNVEQSAVSSRQLAVGTFVTVDCRLPTDD